MQATALVREAYLRLVDVKKARPWDSRGHFFAAAAEAMRRILINRARAKSQLKRGGGYQRVSFDQIEMALDAPPEDLLAVDEAITQLAAAVSVVTTMRLLNIGTGILPRRNSC